MLIFPKSTVTDTQELQRVRAEAARMAARAIETGTTGLGIVPLGITYEDKVSTRSRVLVEIGERITDAEMTAMADGTDITEGNHGFVQHLAETIRTRLADVSPNYGSLLGTSEGADQGLWNFHETRRIRMPWSKAVFDTRPANPRVILVTHGT